MNATRAALIEHHEPRNDGPPLIGRRALLGAALAAVAATTLPPAVRATAVAGPAWGPYVELPDERRDDLVSVLDQLTFPWARMHAGMVARAPGHDGRLRIVWSDGLPRFDFHLGVVELRRGSSTRALTFDLPHELGHVVDDYMLERADRDRISWLLHGNQACDDQHPWLGMSVPHGERVGERAATLIGELFGGRFVHHGTRDHYGPDEYEARAAGRRPDLTLDTIATIVLTKEARMFTDVSGNDVHARNIEDLAKVEVVEGWEDGTFRPNDSVTRGQLASMLARALDVVDRGWRP